jgi:hypothetical protein
MCNNVKFLNVICPNKPKILILLQVNQVNFTINL